MSDRREVALPDVTTVSIEHLDFAPMCEAKCWDAYGCHGQNDATYLATSRYCCPLSAYICDDCVAWRVAFGPTYWRCLTCRNLSSLAGWLDLTTLHPLRPTP